MFNKPIAARESELAGSVLRTARRTALALMFAAIPVIALNSSTPAAYGQASSSSDAAGKVTDATGAVIPGATIHLINNGTKAERTTTSNSSGDWSIPNLPPANYSLTIEKQGFRSATIPSLDVEIGKAANGSVTLQVGGANETVEVSTLPPQLQTQEATVGQVIDQKQINDLPLNGRNVLQLATLAPGVSPPQTGQTGRPAQTGQRDLFITVDGGRGSSTNYVLDGTYVRSVRFNNMSIQPNLDTIQEFNLLRSVFSTEYGQGQAVVSMVTKSGTNSLHGSAYEFARNAIFDARNYFVTPTLAPQKPDFYRHQFGGTVGFPIVKDKFFLFAGYEGLRSSKGTALTALYPTQNELNGIADPNEVGCKGTGCIPTNNKVGSLTVPYSAVNPAGFTVTSTAALALNPTYPVVTTDVATCAASSNYCLSRQFTDHYNEYTVRADQTLSSKNSLFERYVDFNSNQISPNANGSSTANPLIGRNAVIGNSYLFSSNLVNEARVGWNEFYNIGLGILQDPSVNWATAEGIKNVTSVTSKRQNGRSSFGIAGGFSNVSDGSGDQGGHENVISVGDSLSKVAGKHTLKIGFQYQNRRLWQIADTGSRGGGTFDNCTLATYKTGYTPTGPNDPNNIVSEGNCPVGQKTYTVNGTTYLYNKYQNYARGMCVSGCSGNDGTTMGHYRDNTYGAFFNDTWQFGHGLTIALGLRWEYNSPWVEQNGLEGSLNPAIGRIEYSKVPSNIPPVYLNPAAFGCTYCTGPAVETSATYKPGIVPPERMGFMPRIGLAYEARTGTVLRAAFGVFLDNLNTNELQFTRYAAPLYFQQSGLGNLFVSQLWPDPILGTGIKFSAANGNSAAGLPAPFSVLPSNSRPYTQEWNASIQQDLGHGLVLELAYTGSNTHKLWKRVDQNMDQVAVGMTSATQVPTRPFPMFGHSMLTSNTRGDSNFNGGSIKIEKRSKAGFYYLGSYQWSKNLDNSSGEAGANDSSYWNNFAFDHSYSNFDVRSRAVISGGYELPFGKGKRYWQSGLGTAIAGGWTLQPAVQLRTGYPFSPSRSGCDFGGITACRVFLAPGRTVASAYKQNPSPFAWFDPTAFSSDPTVASTSTSAAPHLQGNVTRNTLRGPGTPSVDLSGIKNFKIGERMNFQFRAEAYNVLNRAIFSNPSANITSTSSVGQVSSTSIDNRSIQLAVKASF